MWRRAKANGDIYKAMYEGYYFVREERFVTDQEAQEMSEGKKNS
jgi:methionyl-tRNA synthetase